MKQKVVASEPLLDSKNLFEHTAHMPQLERAAEIAFLLRQTAK